MKPYSKRIEEANKQHAEKIAELESEADLAAQLPPGAPVPYMIHFASTRPWLSYKVKTLLDAFNIVRAFPAPLDVSARQQGCIHGASYRDAKVKWTVPNCIEVAQQGGRGFYVATLAFWCETGGRPLVKVVIEIEQFPYNLRARMNARYDSYGNVWQAEFIEGRIPAETHPAASIKFGAGGLDSFDIRHYFKGIEHAMKLMEVK